MAREVEYTSLEHGVVTPQRGWLFAVLCHSACGPGEISELTMIVEDEEGKLLYLSPQSVRFVSGVDHQYARSWQCVTNLSVLTALESRSAGKPSEKGETLVLYDGPDAVELTPTAYRRAVYPEFRDPNVSKVMVSPSMLLAIREREDARIRDR